MSKPRVTTDEQSTHSVLNHFLPMGRASPTIGGVRTFYELQKAYLPECVYCGEPATTKDHVPPKVWAPMSRKTYPACHRCNCKILIDKALLTLEDRKEYVRQWRIEQGELV